MFNDIFDFSVLVELLDWRSLAYLLLAAILLTLFKFLNGLFSGYRLTFELTERDNKAVAVSLAGFLFALCIIIQGVLFNPSDLGHMLDLNRLWDDLKSTAIWSGIGCGFLLISRLVNDKFILPQFSNKKELVQDRNVGVGFVQAASYISTALIIRATISGETKYSLGDEVILTSVWFVCTQFLLIVFSHIYQIVTNYELHEELEKDNIGAGVAFGGNITAFGILLSFYISRSDSIVGMVVWAGLACLLLWVVRVAVDKLLLPKTKLDKEIAEDKNWGAGAIEAVTVIGSALIITGSFS